MLASGQCDDDDDNEDGDGDNGIICLFRGSVIKVARFKEKFD